MATPKLTARQTTLMTAIGRREFSFFDNGIEADSGIWHECLTGEADTVALGTNPRGVANIVGALVRKGLLGLSDEGNGDVWVWLTAEGAALANQLAKK